MSWWKRMQWIRGTCKADYYVQSNTVMWILSQITTFRGSHTFAVYAHNAYVHVNHYVSTICHDNYARMIKWSSDQGNQEFSNTPSEFFSLQKRKTPSPDHELITRWSRIDVIIKMFAQKPHNRTESFISLESIREFGAFIESAIALLGSLSSCEISWHDDERNGINLVMKINRCDVKIEIPRRSNNDSPVSGREKYRKYRRDVWNKVDWRVHSPPLADIKIEFITF